MPLVPPDPPMDAISELRDIEVQQQSNARLTEIQVEISCAVCRQDMLHRLHLDDYLVFNDEVDTVAERNRHAIVNDGKRYWRGATGVTGAIGAICTKFGSGLTGATCGSKLRSLSAALPPFAMSRVVTSSLG